MLIDRYESYAPGGFSSLAVACLVSLAVGLIGSQLETLPCMHKVLAALLNRAQKGRRPSQETPEIFTSFQASMPYHPNKVNQ